jgi:hypothetical protein
MSYYDDSSLFVAPNGYKTSVLFAQKPMDANGQLAFTRSNDTATRVAPDGLIEKVRTNLILQSNSHLRSNTSTTNQGFVLSDAMGSLGGVPSGSTMYFWKSQVETGDIATDYIPTTTTAVSVGPVANLPRIDYPINSDGSVGCPSLLLEPQTTALNQFSESFDNAYWQLKTDVTIEANTTDTLDPAGYYGAEKITETATTARHRLASNGTTSSTVNHTASVFMKKGTARYGFVTYAAGTIYTIIVDLEDGTITQTSTSGTIVAQKVEDYGNGWYRISVTGLSGISGSTQYALQFGSAGSAVPSSYVSNIPSFTGSTSNYLYAWGANLTATSYLQSYVPTLGASVTRGADSCSKQNIAGTLPTAYPFTLFAEFEVTPAIEGQALTFSNIASPTEYFSIDHNTGFYRALSRPSGTISLVQSTTPATVGTHKICAVFTSTAIKLFLDGVLESSGANAQAFNASINDILVGQLRSVSDTGNRNSVKQSIVFKSALSDDEVIDLTTL